MSAYDKIQLTTVENRTNIETFKSTLNSYEPVIVKDEDNILWKDSDDNIHSINILLTSPDGSVFKMSVANDGTLSSIKQ